jgi:hypothetical protein
MSYLYILSSFGLLLDMVGAIMLFKYGLPSEVSKEGNITIVMEQTDEKEIEKWKKYNRYSKFALTFLLTGFLLQFIPSVIQIFPQ